MPANGPPEDLLSAPVSCTPPPVVADALGVADGESSAVAPPPLPPNVTGIRTVWLWSPPRVWSLRVMTAQVMPDLVQSVFASFARTLISTENEPLCPLPSYGLASPSPYDGGLEATHTDAPDSPDMSTPPTQGVGVLPGPLSTQKAT